MLSGPYAEVVWSDPGWLAAGVAVLALAVSVWSAGLSWRSLRWERSAAQSARRSAEAAERANLLTERVLAGAGTVAVDSPSTAPDVSWRIESAGKNRFVLRNIGTGVAEHVGVDDAQLGDVMSSHLPTDAVVRPGEGVDVLLRGTWQSGGLPNQLYVRWAGSDGYHAVPLSG